MKMKNQDGITLVTLVTTVILLLLLTSTISISIISSVEIAKYNALKEDIDYLESKIAIYYLETNNLPIGTENINISELIEGYNSENINFNPNNSGILCNIDLSKINVDVSDLNYKYYYVDEQSHTIYCKKYIKYNNMSYYTAYKNYKEIALEP